MQDDSHQADNSANSTSNTNQNSPKPQVTSTDPLLLQPDQLEPADKDGQLGEGSNEPSNFRQFGAFIGVLCIAALLAFLLITFVFRSYAVDGSSMVSTLKDQDKLIIWKLPETLGHITGHPYVPKRGDIIVVNQDDLSACGQVGSRQIIKRVIGLPGDHVTIKNDQYVIYNAANPQGFKPDEALAYNKDGHVPGPTGAVDVTLGKDQLFVSGDNRPGSCDSRSFGPVQLDKVVGKLVIRLLPANKIKIF